MLDLIVKQFLTPQRINDLKEKLKKEYDAVELEPGETSPFWTLSIVNDELKASMVVLKNVENKVEYSRCIKSIKLDELITEIISK